MKICIILHVFYIAYSGAAFHEAHHDKSERLLSKTGHDLILLVRSSEDTNRAYVPQDSSRTISKSSVEGVSNKLRSTQNSLWSGRYATDSTKKIQSGPNTPTDHGIKQLSEFDKMYWQQQASNLESEPVQQTSPRTLRVRQFVGRDLAMNGSPILLRRASPSKATKTEQSPPKVKPTDTPAAQSRQKTPLQGSPPPAASDSRPATPQKQQKMLPSASVSINAPKSGQHPGKTDLAPDMPANKNRSPSPPALRQTKSSRNLFTDLNLEQLDPSNSHSDRSGSPRPTFRSGAQTQQAKQAPSSGIRSAISTKAREPKRIGKNASIPLPSSFLLPGMGSPTSSNTDTRWPSPGRATPPAGRKIDLSNLPKSPFDQSASPKRSSSPERPKVDLSDLPRSPFDRPASPKRLSSPPKLKINLSDLPKSPFDRPASPTRSFSTKQSFDDNLPSPRSAFADEGWAVPSWLVSNRPPSPERPRSPTKEEAIAELKGQKKSPSRSVADRTIKKFMRMPSIPSPKAQLSPPRLKIPSVSSISSSSSIATSPFGSPEYQSRPPFERPSPGSFKDLSESLTRGGSASQLDSVVLPSSNAIPKAP